MTAGWFAEEQLFVTSLCTNYDFKQQHLFKKSSSGVDLVDFS